MNRISITVASLSGNFSDEFNVHQKVRHVLEKAFKGLNIVPAEGEVWELRYNNAVLNLDQSLEAAGVVDGATLLLAPREGGGGAAWTKR